MPLVGYWPLNETSGSTAYDRSGQENHGSLNGGVTQGANGILGNNAYQLDGTDDYVDVGSNTGEGSNLTVSAWINLNSLPSSGFTTINTKRRVAALSIDGGSGGELHGNMGDGSSWGNSVNGSVLSTNEWIHIAAIYNSSDKLVLYQNGEEDARTSQSISIGSNSNARGIGAKYKSGWTNFLDGRIADVRIYNHALTPSEVQYLYEVAKRGKMITDKRSP
jgi:hypothetical protein